MTVHHYVLKDTTVASGEWEGVGHNTPGSGSSTTTALSRGHAERCVVPLLGRGQADSGAFERELGAEPGRVQLWLAGHTHTHPDDNPGGKSHVERRWGTWFIERGVAQPAHMPITTLPISRLLTFTPGSNRVRVQCYLHTSSTAPRRGGTSRRSASWSSPPRSSGEWTGRAERPCA